MSGTWRVDLPGKSGNVDYWAHYLVDGQDRPACRKIIPGKQWIIDLKAPRCRHCEAAV